MKATGNSAKVNRALLIIHGEQQCENINDYIILHLSREARDAESMEHFVAVQVDHIAKNHGMPQIYKSLFGDGIGSDLCRMYRFLK